MSQETIGSHPQRASGLAVDLENVSEAARSFLEEANHAREEALSLSRELIRTSANSIRATHRNDGPLAQELLKKADRLAGELSRLRESRADIFFAGYVQDSLKEFAEARSVYALVHEQPLPDAAELGIPWAAYLNGLGEAVGEMRRHCLDLLRGEDVSRATTILEAMESIYAVLVTVDYPDALTGGLRRTTDAVRGILERTRADLTAAVLQRRLALDMERLAERLGRMTTNGQE